MAWRVQTIASLDFVCYSEFVDEYIRELVDHAPPLTPEQVQELRDALTPVGLIEPQAKSKSLEMAVHTMGLGPADPAGHVQAS